MLPTPNKKKWLSFAKDFLFSSSHLKRLQLTLEWLAASIGNDALLWNSLAHTHCFTVLPTEFFWTESHLSSFEWLLKEMPSLFWYYPRLEGNKGNTSKERNFIMKPVECKDNGLNSKTIVKALCLATMHESSWNHIYQLCICDSALKTSHTNQACVSVTNTVFYTGPWYVSSCISRNLTAAVRGGAAASLLCHLSELLSGLSKSTLHDHEVLRPMLTDRLEDKSHQGWAFSKRK